MKRLRGPTIGCASHYSAATLNVIGGHGLAGTTGVPAMIGAMMMLTGKWHGAGVFNMEQFDPQPFMEKLNLHGLPWQIEDRPEGLAI